jgi:hypothetical protein
VKLEAKGTADYAAQIDAKIKLKQKELEQFLDRLNRGFSIGAKRLSVSGHHR